MAKKSKTKIDLSQKSVEELTNMAKEEKAKFNTMRLNINTQNPHEKRMLRRSIARTLTALKQKTYGQQ